MSVSTSERDFAEECLRQSLLLRDDPQEEIMRFLENVADTDGWICE
jgi:hypothetical protein